MYAPRVPKCHPITDGQLLQFVKECFQKLSVETKFYKIHFKGISSLDDLLAAPFVRVTLWLVAAFIMNTNLLVLSKRLSNSMQQSPLNLVFYNLAGKVVCIQ